jgi:hypothetical protein
MFAFAVDATRSDGADSVWIVDSEGVLILPADRRRLERDGAPERPSEPSH